MHGYSLAAFAEKRNRNTPKNQGCIAFFGASRATEKKVDGRKIFEVSSQVRASRMNDILTMQQTF